MPSTVVEPAATCVRPLRARERQSAWRRDAQEPHLRVLDGACAEVERTRLSLQELQLVLRVALEGNLRLADALPVLDKLRGA